MLAGWLQHTNNMSELGFHVQVEMNQLKVQSGTRGQTVPLALSFLRSARLEARTQNGAWSGVLALSDSFQHEIPVAVR